MSKPPCQSSLYKLHRAEEHRKLIFDEIMAWNHRGPYKITRQKNQDDTRHSVIFNVQHPPDLIRWALIAGDCIHNLRSALDHCVYDIAVHEGGITPPTDERVLQFPISDTPKQY